MRIIKTKAFDFIAILLVLILSIPTDKAEAAAFATGGTSPYRNSVLWLTWGGGPNGTNGVTLRGNSHTIDGVLQLGAAGSRSSATLQVADDTTLEYTCIITRSELTKRADQATSKPLLSYASGGYPAGDSLDYLYNIGGTGTANKLVSGILSEAGTASLTIQCSAQIVSPSGGTPYDIRGLVIADSESLAASPSESNPIREFIEGTAAGNWSVVEVRKNPATANPYYVAKSGTGTQTITLGPGNDNKTAAVSFLTFNAPSSTASMDFKVRGGGKQAIAIGILAPYADFSDAPSSYGSAMHVVADLTLSDDGIPADNPAENVNSSIYRPGGLVSPSTDYLGSQGPDTEQAAPFSADARGDDIYPANNASEEDAWPTNYTISVLERGNQLSQTIACKGSGTISGWIDFNINGQFDAAEKASTTCAGTTATLTWTVPTDTLGGVSYVRLRYATVAAQVENPTGIAQDGEVEDHRITISAPKLAITKSSNAVSNRWTVNQADAKYQLTIRNDGPVATGATGLTPAAIQVLDTLPAGIEANWTGTLITGIWSCSVAGQLVSCSTEEILGPSGSSTSSSLLTLPVKITEEINGATATNYASVAGGRDPFNGGVPPTPGTSCTDATHCASHRVTIDWDISLALEKTSSWIDANNDGLLNLGETVTYRFKITNTGSSTLTNVTVTDPLAGLVMSGTPIAELKPGQSNSTNYTGSYVILQTDVDNGFLKNTATAQATPPLRSGTSSVTSPPSSVTLPPEQSASITLKKTGSAAPGADGVMNVGDLINYTFTVTNTGNTTLSNVTVTDNDLPPGAVTGGPISTLAPGGSDSSTFTATYAVTQADIDAGQKSNTAFASGKPPGTLPHIDSLPSTSVVPLASEPGLSIIKSAVLNEIDTEHDGYTSWTNGILDVDETITYTFTVKNTGNVTLYDVTVVDQLPGLTVTPTLVSSLLPDATAVFSAQHVVTQLDVDRAAVTNTAYATGKTPADNPINSPPDSVTVPASEEAKIAIVKSFSNFTDVDNSGTDNGGDIANYTFTVTNTGKVTLTDISVTDILPQAVVSGSLAILAPGASNSTSFTATYLLTQADIDAGKIDNSAIAKGWPPNNRPEISSTPSAHSEPITPVIGLSITKAGRYEDTVADNYASAGDTLTYTFTVTNTGTTTMTNVSPVDDGPMFDGVNGTGSLSAFSPAQATLTPGASQVFTASYVLTEADAERSAGKTDNVTNTAAAKGVTLSGTPYVTTDVPAVLTLPSLKPGAMSLTKSALTRQVRRGEQAAFRIELTNNSAGNVSDISIIDGVPSGFRYVDGSATVDGVPTNPSTIGRELSFPGISLSVGQKTVIELRLVALATATPGIHTNVADAYSKTGEPIAPRATAGFELIAEAVFDCTDIIGKVFNDRNQNGYQDDGEPGLPASRLVTARGLVITTDNFGRYSIPCAAIPDASIGSNFVLKLDDRSLPTGFALTTENPEVARLTAGKMAEINFGASLGREIRLDLDNDAFVGTTDQPIIPLLNYLPELVTLLAQDRSYLRLGYLARGSDSMAEPRLRAIEQLVHTLWNERSRSHPLVIELAWEQR